MYDVIVNGEWIFTGEQETALKIADNFWLDEDFFGNCSIEKAK